jgi:hypothetical protein
MRSPEHFGSGTRVPGRLFGTGVGSSRPGCLLPRASPELVASPLSLALDLHDYHAPLSNTLSSCLAHCKLCSCCSHIDVRFALQMRKRSAERLRLDGRSP